MTKVFILFQLFLFCLAGVAQGVYLTKEASLGFYSSGIIEDIKAETNEGMSAINTENDNVYFKVGIEGFEFENSLMQEHFNENYMETDKYPYAEYNGYINDKIKWKKGENYNVSITGTLKIHGVEQERTDEVIIQINEDGEIKASAKFIVKLEDHDVAIPRLLIKNIAEEVEVTVSGIYKKQ